MGANASDKTEILELRSKSQITLPASVVKQLDLKTGDRLELKVDDGRIIIEPVITIPKSQAWYWTQKWQEMEHQADVEIKEGKYKSFDSMEELIKDLDK